ncbi:hypothetical protein GCM10011575_13140 [Microlunatus endophyticus]|uniref:Uncharacterized protein n=1 Tax=Microlunatus endophyticus TaxID=1716077 RepID=A0A917W309_9ACTN|nr:hypothetical protein GCM10011575_13140 [Microlunatus endophyticus]
MAVVSAARKWLGPRLGRHTLVGATTWGLRGVRAAETGAENARLFGADVLAEARQNLGETAPPPGFEPSHDHEH